MTLTDFICEALGFSITAETAKEAYDIFISYGYKEITLEFCEDLFSLWSNKFNNTDKANPFRFNKQAKQCKLARVYFNESTINSLRDICNKYHYKLINNRDNAFSSSTLHSIKIGNKTIQEGDGSAFGSRSAKGLGFEKELKDRIIDIVKNGEDSIHYKSLQPLIESGALNNLITDYKNNPEVDLDSRITLTGKKSVFRNKLSQIVDKNTFAINTGNIESILDESGEIIADITIDNQTFISVKMKEAQLSGITAHEIFDNNNTFRKSIQNGVAWSEIEKEQDMVPFINFSEQFGINPQELYEMYLNKKSGYLNIGSYSSRNLGILIQKLVGGNYWYINDSGACFYVSSKARDLDVDIKKASVTESGKGIRFECTVNNKVKGVILFRTDGKSDLPYRLFPYFNVKDLISL